LEQVALAVQDMNPTAYFGKRWALRMKNVLGVCPLRAQVRYERIPDIARQRKHSLAVAFGTTNCYGPAPPVNVMRAKVGNFSEPQPEPKKQEQ
jgi:hypothetical protein